MVAVFRCSTVFGSVGGVSLGLTAPPTAFENEVKITFLP